LRTTKRNQRGSNILDLGFFRAIQSFNDHAPANEMELIASVQSAYDRYPLERINRVWLSLQAVLNEIIECHGNNDYTLPHMRKERLQREGRLPVVIPVSDAAFPLLLMGMGEEMGL
jgi:hypothetical protein